MQPRGTCGQRGVSADCMLALRQALGQASSTEGAPAREYLPGTKQPMHLGHQRTAACVPATAIGGPQGPPHAASPQNKTSHTVADREKADKDGLGVGRTPQRRYQLSEVVQEHEATAHACRVQGQMGCMAGASQARLCDSCPAPAHTSGLTPTVESKRPAPPGQG